MYNGPSAHLHAEQNVPNRQWSSDRWISCLNTVQTKVAAAELCMQGGDGEPRLH